jgi:CBS domain-containing protein
MRAKDVMKTCLITLEPTDAAWLASHKMRWANIRHLPVLHSDRLVGLLSQHDLAVHHARTGNGGAERVERIMSKFPGTCAPDDSITEIAARMADDKIDCLPVLDRGRLVGIVTTTDILNAHVHAAMETAGQSAQL